MTGSASSFLQAFCIKKLAVVVKVVLHLQAVLEVHVQGVRDARAEVGRQRSVVGFAKRNFNFVPKLSIN